jgi:hypothetical protein
VGELAKAIAERRHKDGQEQGADEVLHMHGQNDGGRIVKRIVMAIFKGTLLCRAGASGRADPGRRDDGVRCGKSFAGTETGTWSIAFRSILALRSIS